jgi:hypothetical protein
MSSLEVKATSTNAPPNFTGPQATPWSKESAENRIKALLSKKLQNSGAAAQAPQFAELIAARQIWSDLAHLMANICLDTNGTVNESGRKALEEFWESVYLQEVPYRSLPGIEMIHDQASAILKKMHTQFPIGNGRSMALVSVLNEYANKPTSASNGQKILNYMQRSCTNPASGLSSESSSSSGPSSSSSSSSSSSNSPSAESAMMKPSHAILQSLFGIHRQIGLPTCNMDAIINAEKFNNPARLARIYGDILTQDAVAKISLASNHQITLQSIDDITTIDQPPTISMRPKEPNNADNQKFLLKEEEDGRAIGITLIMKPIEPASASESSPISNSSQSSGHSNLLSSDSDPSTSTPSAVSPILGHRVESASTGKPPNHLPPIGAKTKTKASSSIAIHPFPFQTATKATSSLPNNFIPEYSVGNLPLSNSSSSANSGENVAGLCIPIRNLDDALLVNLMQNVYGDNGVVVTEGFVKTRELYFGIKGNEGFLAPIKCNNSHKTVHYFDTNAMQALQGQANILSIQGISVVSTMFSQPSENVSGDSVIKAQTVDVQPFNLDKINGHVENLYLEALKNILTLENGKFRIVGDRNWVSEKGEPIYLVVCRTEDRFAFTDAKIMLTDNRRQLIVENDNKASYGERGQLCFYNSNDVTLQISHSDEQGTSSSCGSCVIL